VAWYAFQPGQLGAQFSGSATLFDVISASESANPQERLDDAGEEGLAGGFMGKMKDARRKELGGTFPFGITTGEIELSAKLMCHFDATGGWLLSNVFFTDTRGIPGDLCVFAKES
jgi:hypothetical protein